MVLRIVLMAATGAVGFLVAAVSGEFTLSDESLPESSPTTVVVTVQAEALDLPLTGSARYDLLGIGPGGQRFERRDLVAPIGILDIPPGKWRIDVRVHQIGGAVIGVGSTSVLIGTQSIEVAAHKLDSEAEICDLYLDWDGHPTYGFNPTSQRCEALTS